MLNAYITRPIRTAGETFYPGQNLGDTNGGIIDMTINLQDVFSQQSTVKISQLVGPPPIMHNRKAQTQMHTLVDSTNRPTTRAETRTST